MSDGKMKKVSIYQQIKHSGQAFCGKSNNDYVQDTIFRIGKLKDHVEKTGMQIATAMPRSLFMRTDKSGGNDV
jgi:hypothetical protein